MLVLTRKTNQSILIGEDIRILVVAIERDQVKLGVEAPRSVTVNRSEVIGKTRKNQAAGS
jgi:carbon storage regulator